VPVGAADRLLGPTARVDRYILLQITQPIRLLARESFINAISKLQNIVYVILLVNHIHQAAQVRIR
jgi:hypothetical protein